MNNELEKIFRKSHSNIIDSFYELMKSKASVKPLDSSEAFKCLPKLIPVEGIDGISHKLIDDEADYASINTKAHRDEITATNKYIRMLRGLFNRSTYVAYTATPFANIFIEPESQDDMEEEDLFPRHFIKALDPPSNYSGAYRIFDPKGDL